MHKIFINSLPKAGTNLLAKILDDLQFEEHTFIGSNLFLGKDVKSRIRRLLSLTFHQGYIVGVDSPTMVNRSYLNRRINVRNNQSNNIYVTAHLGYTNDILNKVIELDYKPITVIRDPRDVLNSFLNYVISNKNHPLHDDFEKLDYAERLRRSLFGFNGKITLQPLKFRCQSINPWIEHPAVEVVKFEDVVGESRGGNLSDQLNFAKKLSAIIDTEPDKILESINNKSSVRHTYRKGIIGGWKDEIPEEFHQLINTEISQILQAWGYKK